MTYYRQDTADYWIYGKDSVGSPVFETDIPDFKKVKEEIRIYCMSIRKKSKIKESKPKQPTFRRDAYKAIMEALKRHNEEKAIQLLSEYWGFDI